MDYKPHYRWVRNLGYHEYSLYHVSKEHKLGWEYLATIYKQSWKPKGKQEWKTITGTKPNKIEADKSFRSSLEARDYVEFKLEIDKTKVVNERRNW